MIHFIGRIMLYPMSRFGEEDQIALVDIIHTGTRQTRGKKNKRARRLVLYNPSRMLYDRNRIGNTPKIVLTKAHLITPIHKSIKKAAPLRDQKGGSHGKTTSEGVRPGRRQPAPDR
jgi:hypothetical protein